MTRLKPGAQLGRPRMPMPTEADLVLLQAKLTTALRQRDVLGFKIANLRTRLSEATAALEAANDRGR